MPDESNPAAEQMRLSDLTAYLPDTGESVELGYDEDTYVRAYPDVAEAIERGDMNSGLEHYLRAGRAEKRLQRPEYIRQVVLDRGANAASAAPAVPVNLTPAFRIEAFAIADSGAVFLVGWTDDRHNPLVAISAGSSSVSSRDWTRFCRLRRPDVENAVQSSSPYHYGFWVFGAPPEGGIRPTAIQHGEWRVELRFANGAVAELKSQPVIRSDTELRDSVMMYFATSEYCGNRWVAAFDNLDQGAGEALVAFNRSISRAITATATAERYGPQRQRFKGSIIVPLFGIPDYLFLQASAYALGPGIADYEFIYVINSPELIDRLQYEARICQTIYGLSQTLVLQNGNAGFGAANNVATQFARSDRLLCVNPDVFPIDQDWARRHTALLAETPAAQTRLFGTTLFYGDGSLMHGGMYFDVDSGVHVDTHGISRRNLLRVEHYGKGAPPGATPFSEPRPVSAVTGAFISVERAWFERLGGFSEDYVFGHYEDADLCLKSLQAGTPVYLHALRMWHLEGKGSRRLPPHEGGSLLNRWLFSQRWEQVIIPNLVGQNPATLRPASDRAPTLAAPSKRAADGVSRSGHRRARA